MLMPEKLNPPNKIAIIKAGSAEKHDVLNQFHHAEHRP
jgi:hypothetical protein